MQFVSLSAVTCYNLASSKQCVSPRDLPQFNVMTFPLLKNLPTVCIYTSVQTSPEVLSMFTVTQLNGTVDNNLHILSDSAVTVLCCCTAVLLHQMSALGTSLHSVDRTNLASSTDHPQLGGLMGGSYRRYLSDKIMSMFPQCRQLIQHML